MNSKGFAVITVLYLIISRSSLVASQEEDEATNEVAEETEGESSDTGSQQNVPPDQSPQPSPQTSPQPPPQTSPQPTPPTGSLTSSQPKENSSLNGMPTEKPSVPALTCVFVCPNDTSVTPIESEYDELDFLCSLFPCDFFEVFYQDDYSFIDKIKECHLVCNRKRLLK